MSESTDNTDGLVTFDDNLDITMAAAYFEKLTKMLNQHKSIALNGAAIERVDGAGLQLLAAFFKEAESLHVLVKWQSSSEILKKSAVLSGLTASLALD